MNQPAHVHEDAVARAEFTDRWSKTLIGTPQIPTAHGFNLGVAAYTSLQFGPEQVHDDQEALYILSGIGEVRVAGKVIAARPGLAIYLPPGTPHASRRTGSEPLKVLYTHAPA